MRISDWSSDVCSSDLLENRTEALADSERVRVNNDVILKLRIIDQLSGQISFGFQYRSDTPEEAEHTDTTTRATVVSDRSEEHTSELQSLMRTSYAVFCLKTKKHRTATQ